VLVTSDTVIARSRRAQVRSALKNRFYRQHAQGFDANLVIEVQ
jgi:hypothetical protein